MVVKLEANWQREFWNSPYSLRFELASGEYVGRYLSRFIDSFDRARTIARMALSTGNVVAVIASFRDPSVEMGAERRGWTSGSGFELLAALGLHTETPIANWTGFWWPGDESDPEEAPLEQRAVRVDWEQADILLWNQVAQDLGVLPSAPVFAKLVDLERSICVHAYDDRGMDVTALDKQPLEAIYDKFEHWLLDHDRDRMSAVFDS